MVNSGHVHAVATFTHGEVMSVLLHEDNSVASGRKNLTYNKYSDGQCCQVRIEWIHAFITSC
jgi:hypothetical protein